MLVLRKSRGRHQLHGRSTTSVRRTPAPSAALAGGVSIHNGAAADRAPVGKAGPAAGAPQAGWSHPIFKVHGIRKCDLSARRALTALADEDLPNGSRAGNAENLLT